MRRGKRAQAGHLLAEALAGGAVILLVLMGLLTSQVASRRVLNRGIDDVELARVATERLEFLRAQPATAGAWTAPSAGAVTGQPGWTWSITPDVLVDPAMGGGLSPSFRRARVTITAVDGRTLTVEALKW